MWTVAAMKETDQRMRNYNKKNLSMLGSSGGWRRGNKCKEVEDKKERVLV